MSRSFFPILLLAVVFATPGCQRSDRPTDVPTVDKFVGQVTHNGKPAELPPESELKVISDQGINFGIPLKPDGSFEIGWMPVGKYAAIITVAADPAKKGTGVRTHTVPGGFEIKEGQTEYMIELGKGWKK